MHRGTLRSVVPISHSGLPLHVSMSRPGNVGKRHRQQCVDRERSAASSHLQEQLCKVDPHSDQPPVGPVCSQGVRSGSIHCQHSGEMSTAIRCTPGYMQGRCGHRTFAYPVQKQLHVLSAWYCSALCKTDPVQQQPHWRHVCATTSDASYLRAAPASPALAGPSNPVPSMNGHAGAGCQGCPAQPRQPCIPADRHLALEEPLVVLQ